MKTNVGKWKKWMRKNLFFHLSIWLANSIYTKCKLLKVIVRTVGHKHHPDNGYELLRILQIALLWHVFFLFGFISRCICQAVLVKWIWWERRFGYVCSRQYQIDCHRYLMQCCKIVLKAVNFVRQLILWGYFRQCRRLNSSSQRHFSRPQEKSAATSVDENLHLMVLGKTFS